jgi:hypothetical protein
MRWLGKPRVMALLLILLSVVIYLVIMAEVFPLLWPYRGHPLVRALLAFLSGGHLEELLQETGALL